MPFEAVLCRYPGPGGWTFVNVPPEHAPDWAGPWGRTPVRATVDGRSWDTSVWRDRAHGTLLPVPKRVRAGKEEGDRVLVSIEPLSVEPVPAGG